MQEEVTQKTIALVFKSSRLTTDVQMCIRDRNMARPGSLPLRWCA